MSLPLNSEAVKTLRTFLRNLLKHFPKQRPSHPIFSLNWALASELTPTDIMDLRGTSRGRFREYYYPRNADKQLCKEILARISPE